MSTGRSGADALAEFAAAPRVVQEQFWAKLRREVVAEHELSQRVEASCGSSPRGWLPSFRWDDAWRRKARIHRVGEEIGWRDSNLAPERERLKDVPTEEYVERLAGIELVRGKALCPLPDHDERTPSFAVQRDHRWRCFGCNRKGDIYDFAAALWGGSLSGGAFLELHKRLAEQWGIGEHTVSRDLYEKRAAA